MPRAIFEGTVIAEARPDQVQTVEGNVYFPPETVHRGFLKESPTPYYCGWKGACTYYHVEVDGHRAEDAAWTYIDPKPEARHIDGWFAFWRSVRVEN